MLRVSVTNHFVFEAWSCSEFEGDGLEYMVLRHTDVCKYPSIL